VSDSGKRDGGGGAHPDKRDGLTYKDSGVDIDEADRLVERIAKLAKSTHGPRVLEGIGGFASLFSLADQRMQEPVLVAGTDGVGTKLKLAFEMDRHDTVGIDLVAMCVNDVITTGATPLFFLDYFGTGKLDRGVGEKVVAGIAEGCRRAGCALVGGETAELPGLYAEGEYDLAGFAVGVVDRAKILDGAKHVQPGHACIGVVSRGLHSNGYSLARKAVLERAGKRLADHAPELGRTVGEAMLEPTAIYVAAARAAIDAGAVALAHITGGGIPGNLPRVFPENVVAEIDRSSWSAPPIFGFVQQCGSVEEAEMFRTFNMGIGLIAVAPKDRAADVRSAIEATGERTAIIGSIRARSEEQEQVILV
jgi:phosphoribosylformylglycinamidine cyclo-ligase